MRILQLSAPTALAGAERVILTYLQHYDTRLFFVRVVSYLNHQRLDNSFTEEIKKLGVLHDKIPIGNTSLIWQVRQTVDLIKRHAINILHTHGYRSDFIGLIAARLTGIPVVSTVHGWTPVSLKLRGYQMLDRFCLKRFNKIICVSNPLYEEFVRMGLGAERLICLPNAVSLPVHVPGQRDTTRQKLGVLPEDKIIVSVGRLSPEKGLDILLSAYARQFSSDQGVRLILVGDGQERTALESLAGSLGIAEKVIFVGFSADVAKYYAAADLFVMSSHTEGFPMALLEAMAWGLPVLATAVGGIPDIIQDGVDGCLVPSGDVEQFATSMRNLLHNSAQAVMIGQFAYKTVAERFSVDQWARALERVYSCINERSEKLKL